LDCLFVAHPAFAYSKILGNLFHYVSLIVVAATNGPVSLHIRVSRLVR
jgi:hypothetical protein